MDLNSGKGTEKKIQGNVVDVAIAVLFRKVKKSIKHNSHFNVDFAEVHTLSSS